MERSQQNPDPSITEPNDEEWQDADAPETFPSGETVRSDRRDASTSHQPDRPPTPEEERLADEHGPVSESTRQAYKEAAERGASLEGEGKVENPAGRG